MSNKKLTVIQLLLLLACFTGDLQASLLERSPISYWQRPTSDITRDLQEELRDGSLSLDTSDEKAMLRLVLDRLDIPVESQVLVFSQTSFQHDKISPLTPRALYFNDTHYVGWVQGGDIELATVDKRLGLTFYQLEMPKSRWDSPRFVRDKTCLACHSGTREKNFPQTMIFSSMTSDKGNTLARAYAENVDHRTPLEKRWGGWYVTAEWEGERHLGNAWFVNEDIGQQVTDKDTDFGVTRATLSDIFDTSPYLTDTSDVIALMVLEHQTLAHNSIVQAFVTSRIALFDDDSYMSGKGLSPETEKIINEQVDLLLDVFLFKNEASLERHTVNSNGDFAAVFEKAGVHDSQGRTLRQIDLNSRLFTYRLSYMIYADAFEYLPQQLQEVFFNKLLRILKQEPGEGAYPYLTSDERQAITEIITTTHPYFTSR